MRRGDKDSKSWSIHLPVLILVFDEANQSLSFDQYNKDKQM